MGTSKTSQSTNGTPSLFERVTDGSLDLNEVHFLTLPTVAWFLVFLILPLAVILVYSFFTYQSFDVIYKFSLKSWTDGVLTPNAISVFARTLGMGVLVTALTIVLGYPVAYFMRFHLSDNAGTLLLLFLVIPFWTSGIIRVLGYYPILGKSGVINQVLIMAGFIEQPIFWLLFSPFSQLVGYIENLIVFMIAPIYISLSQLDEGLLDASETLRGDPVETFVNVTWPLSLPGVTIGTIFVFVLTIGNFAVPTFLSGGASTISTFIYLTVSSGLRYPTAAALSIALLAVIFAIVFTLTRWIDITEIAQA